MNRPPPPNAARLLTAVLLLTFSLSAAAQNDPPAPDILRPGDALFVRIDRLGGHLPAYREIVDSDGDIELPVLGMMAAAYATARLASNAAIRLTFITHFEPPPDREALVRVQDPRRPAPAQPAE